MAITVKSDFWGNNYSLIQDQSNFRKIIARMFNLRQNRDDQALMKNLVANVTGQIVTVLNKRVAADRLENGGKRTIESEVLINRATTAADVTALQTKILTYASRPTSYPVDKATRP